MDISYILMELWPTRKTDRNGKCCGTGKTRGHGCIEVHRGEVLSQLCCLGGLSCTVINNPTSQWPKWPAVVPCLRDMLITHGQRALAHIACILGC